MAVLEFKPREIPAPCAEYDRRMLLWSAAVRREAELREATVELVRTVGRRKAVEVRIEARHSLAAVEAGINSHIDGCAECRSARRKKLNQAKVQPDLS